MVFISSTVPQWLQTPHNPDGAPQAVIDSFQTAMAHNRAQLFIDIPTGPFFGYNRPGATASQGLIGTRKSVIAQPRW